MRSIFKDVLVIGISLIILVNFILPNYSYAEEKEDIESIPEYDPDKSVSKEDLIGIIQSIFDATQENDNEEEEGGELFTPISQFLLGIADGIMSTLQATFIGDGKASNIITANAIKETTKGNEGGKGVTTYKIKYSPAAIFSGRIPVFDINFFQPLGDKNGNTKYYKTKIDYNTVETNLTYEECRQRYGANNYLQSVRDRMSLTELLAHGIALISIVNAVEALANTDFDYATYGGGAEALTIGGTAIGSVPMPSDQGAISIAIFLGAASAAEGVALADRLKDKHLYYMQWQQNGETYFYICDSELWKDIEQREKIKGTLYKLGETITEEFYEKTSTAYTLRPIIATWYMALRNFALVGLLSVLVYVGIRIIISSTAQDKAKYKKMLIDWLTAVLILFVLHYGMVFIMNIMQKITDIFTVSNISINGTDKFITNIRNMATGNNNDSYFTYFGYVIMYIALTVLTVVFTIQYIKRLVFIAFLTMIAPLIALTYPIDRIKDGQAQAFSTWIKEYVFNCLLQPVHLLLYTIFIESASQLVNVNPVYAIIVLAFFTPAEKFFRKMFGFEKATSIGAIGSAAGGAILMNMINKLRGKSEHGKNSLEEKNNNKNKVRTVEENQNNTEKPMSETMQNNIEDKKDNKNAKMKENNLQGQNHIRNSDDVHINEPHSIKTKVEGKSSNKKSITGTDMLKSTGKWVAKTGRWATNSSIKAAGAFTGATIGLAAGVASGNLGDTAKYVGAGAVAGANITSGINRRIQNHLRNPLYENYKQKPFENSGDKLVNDEDIQTKQNKEQISEAINIQEKTKEFINNGITDTSKIKSAIENNISGKEYKTYQEAGLETVNDMIRLKENMITAPEYRTYTKAGISDIDQIMVLSNEGITGEEYKSYLNAGINTLQEMQTLKQKEITGEEYKSYSNSGISSLEEMQILKQEGITKNEYQAYQKLEVKTVEEMSKLKKQQITPQTVEQLKRVGQNDMEKVISAKKKHPDYTNERLTNMFKLAKNAPRTLPEFKNIMMNQAINGNKLTEEEAEKIFNDLIDFF